MSASTSVGFVMFLFGSVCPQVLQFDEACRAAGVKFMAAAAAGPAGWFFADLQEHTYTPKVRGCEEGGWVVGPIVSSMLPACLPRGGGASPAGLFFAGHASAAALELVVGTQAYLC